MFLNKIQAMKKSEINIRIGNKIREIRQSKGLSQEQLAEIAEVQKAPNSKHPGENEKTKPNENRYRRE